MCVQNFVSREICKKKNCFTGTLLLRFQKTHTDISGCLSDMSLKRLWILFLSLRYKLYVTDFFQRLFTNPLCVIIQSKKEEGQRQRRRKRSSLLFRGHNRFNSLPRQLFSTILHLNDLKKELNSSVSSFCPSAIHPILHNVLVQFIIFFKSSQCIILQ